MQYLKCAYKMDFCLRPNVLGNMNCSQLYGEREITVINKVNLQPILILIIEETTG